MKKCVKFSVLCLIIAMLLSAFSPALAYSSSVLRSADTLYTLGLIRGTENGLELDVPARRCEAAALVIRLTGRESEAMACTYSNPFTDVPDWAQPYISFGYANGLVKGVDESHCEAESPVSANDFLTLILRALGYDDSNGDFYWSSAAVTGFSLGLGRGDYPVFTRGDMFEIALSALSADTVSGDRLIDRLVSSGIVERARANAVGLLEATTYTAREISDKFSPAVFLAFGYCEFEDIENDMPHDNASGFFITPDGLAVTNYHAIQYDKYVYITTLDGERYPVNRVLYYDADIDIAVMSVSHTAVSGKVTECFPYLEMAPSDLVHNGDPVYTLSSPLGLSNSISSGIVGNRARTVDGFALPMIQNTAPISSGSSGGALLNEYGQVIGVTSAMFLYGQSLYLAVPMDPVLIADLTGPGESLITVAEAEYSAAESENE